MIDQQTKGQDSSEKIVRKPFTEVQRPPETLSENVTSGNFLSYLVSYLSNFGTHVFINGLLELGTSFKLPNKTADPAKCQVGELVVVDGVLKVCSAVDTWTSLGASAAYGGKVDSAATSEVVPTGWSASYNSGTKIYTVTHNLGTTAYAVVAMAPSFALQPVLQSLGSDTFTIDFENSSGTAFATDFHFVLIPIV